MWRCANDFFGYCMGQPEWEVQPQTNWAQDDAPRGGTCKKGPRECPKYRTLAGLLEEKGWLAL